ncbi:clathrin light chain A [Sarotherodon galilaeus]
MNLSVLLLLALPVFSSASLHDTENTIDVRCERMVVLEWVAFRNSLPSDAVSIYNDYVGRTDYICKYGCDTGFYTPGKGPYCYYPSNDKEHKGTPFDILVNKDNFELLEWKDDSYGSVPQDSVCPCSNICAFFLPYNGYEYWYKYYQVLTTSDNIVSEHIDDVQYDLQNYKISNLGILTMTESTIKNYDCNPAQKTDALTATYQVEKTWETTSSVSLGVETTITAGIPEIMGTTVKISVDVTFKFTKRTTVTESVSDSSTLTYTVPPNRSCKVLMKGQKAKLNIPFTARVSRTYGDEKKTTTTTTIKGVYNDVQMINIETVLDQCKILDESKKCP